MTELLKSLTWWAWLITLLLGAVAVAAVFVLGYLICLGAVKQMIEDRQRRKLWLKVNGIGQR
jgi:predicted phage tail protein